jgi:hypothetical protein
MRNGPKRMKKSWRGVKKVGPGVPPIRQGPFRETDPAPRLKGGAEHGLDTSAQPGGAVFPAADPASRPAVASCPPLDAVPPVKLHGGTKSDRIPGVARSRGTVRDQVYRAGGMVLREAGQTSRAVGSLGQSAEPVLRAGDRILRLAQRVSRAEDCSCQVGDPASPGKHRIYQRADWMPRVADHPGRRPDRACGAATPTASVSELLPPTGRRIHHSRRHLAKPGEGTWRERLRLPLNPRSGTRRCHL